LLLKKKENTLPALQDNDQEDANESCGK